MLYSKRLHSRIVPSKGGQMPEIPDFMKHVTLMDPYEYDWIMTKNREYHRSLGHIEAPVQHRPSILAACEDPFTLATFNYMGEVWPQPQTGQMWLEWEILTRPQVQGVYCDTTSFRNEPDPIPGRHDKIFKMFEAETRGTFDDLINLLCGKLEHIGFGPRSEYKILQYEEVAKFYGVEELKAEHETRMEKDFGPVCLLIDFPVKTSPFWNMKRVGNIAKKIDGIICGMEAIGSAERSTDPDEMLHAFHTVSNGGYAKRLFSEFGKDRVIRELNAFLSLPFESRIGYGDGLNRQLRGARKLGIMPSFEQIKEVVLAR